MSISEMLADIRRLASDDKGVTAVEYGILGAVIIVVALVAAQLVGTNLTAALNTIAGALVRP